MVFGRSSRQRLVLIVSLGCAAACATVPLSPPIAEPIQGAPEEFRWLQFQWTDGVVLSYIVDTSIETTVGERFQTNRQRSRFRMSAQGSVVSGVRRVRLAFDDYDIGDALLDEQGHLKDVFFSVSGSGPMFDELRAGLVRAAQHPLQRRFDTEALRLNEQFTGNVLLSDIVGKMVTPATTPESSTRMTVVYTGRRRVNGAVAAELLSSFVLAPDSSYLLTSPDGRMKIELNSVSGESRDYLDPDRRYRILAYDVTTVAGVGMGRRWSAKQVSVTTLDRATSRGI